MNGEATCDLSGRWHGVFSYPRALPPTEFDAELRDISGLISGVTSEAHHADSGLILGATLDGSHDGGTIRFRKTYDDFDGEYEAVTYEGIIDQTGDEISGPWIVPGAWGTFLMVRAAGQKATEAQKVSEKIEL
jgi:hypothetical protein